jgi:hypothetical protein
MTREDITRMAREAGVRMDYIFDSGTTRWILQPGLMRFAALVAEAEREACRRACKTLADAAQEEAYYRGHMECEAAIRARGET